MSRAAAPATALSPGGRAAVLAAAFLGLVFDGFELGLMPMASLSVTKSLLGADYTPAAGGDWFARYTAALMLGAAIGGILLGRFGDRYGRSRGLGASILVYSIGASAGGFVTSQWQMLALRFVVGLGVGGVWPNGIALVAESWPAAAKATVAGVMTAGINIGVIVLSQCGRIWPITPDSWRWLFQVAGLPAALGLAVLVALPESPQWLARRAGRDDDAVASPPPGLFGPTLRGTTLSAILIASIPMVGAWSASKWMIPWADAVAGPSDTTYKAVTQGWWAAGSLGGSFCGAVLCGWLGRRTSYLAISAGATLATLAMFNLTAPLRPFFHQVVCLQGFVSTLFFGWLAVYLPSVFPLDVRAAGSGLAYNAGRFVTAAGVLAAGTLFTALGGDYVRVGSVCSLVYALGLVAMAKKR